MNSYIEFKVKKKYFVMLLVVLGLVLGLVGYYVYCSYHPDLSIEIGPGTAGENYNVEAPYIVSSQLNGIKTASKVQLHIDDLVMQHEFMCKSIRENYQSSNLKLKMTVNNKKTILTYYGKVVTLKGKTKNFKEKITCDYVLDAKIKHQ